MAASLAQAKQLLDLLTFLSKVDLKKVDRSAFMRFVLEQSDLGIKELSALTRDLLGRAREEGYLVHGIALRAESDDGSWFIWIESQLACIEVWDLSSKKSNPQPKRSIPISF